VKNIFWGVNCLWVLFAIPLAASTARIYVTNSAGTTVQVIDPATNKIVQTIPDLEVAEAVQFSRDGSQVYVGNRSDHIFVLDRKTGTLIKKVPISGPSNDMAVTKDGKQLLVCINHGVAALDIIDTATLEKVKSIPTKGGLHDIVVTGDGKYAIAGSPEAKLVIVFDLQTDQIAWEVPFEEGIAPLAVENGRDGSGRRVFVQIGGLDGFVIVDFAKRQEVGRVKYPGERSGPKESGTVSHGIGITPDGKTLWATSRTFNSVFVYSMPELKLLGQIPMPELKLQKGTVKAESDWITFTPDGKRVYISNRGLHSVTAIDVATMKKITDIQVGEGPNRISTLVVP
jgi:YVTN family beta-propeller protein